MGKEIYQIQLTNYAQYDLDDIYNYIKRDSIYYAIKTKNEIEDRIAELMYIPYLGSKLDNFDFFGFRGLIYKLYKIIYSARSNKIYIHRILHSARLLSLNLIEN